MRDLHDIRHSHSDAVRDHGFTWGDSHRSPSSLYTSSFERCSFKMLQEGRKDKIETFQPGSFVSVNLPSKTSEDGTGRGDIYAPSIARIEAVFEDRRGCCHVALRYFWRWGQIHKDGDLHHALRPSHRAQLFLQKEVTLCPAGMEGRAGPGSYNTLRFADGCFKELLPAIQLNGLVTVLPKAVVLQQWGGAGGDEDAALARYEANWGSQGAGVDPISGARSNGFWFQYTFDPTCYSFETANPEDLPAIKLPGSRGKKQQQHPLHTGSSQDAAAAGGDKVKRLAKELGLTMGDAFCGMGTVSIAANEVGWQVEFGIDSSRDALASFRANTSHSAAAPFNAVTGRPPADLPPLKVEQVVAQARSGRLALPAVDWLHLSPPCQNVSQKKSLEQRVFSGAELTSALELVGLLQPSFVTLEEVLGFLAQKFLPQNLKGVLAGFPNEPSAPEHSSSSAADAAADDSEDEDTDGEEDEGGGDSEDDQEGEGLADVAGEDGTEEDTAAAGDSSGRPAAVLLNPVLMVVAGLLDQGYQVRLCLLNAAHYGVPQMRWRVVLLAAKHGCQLPEPPPPRYALPEGASSKPRVPATDTGFLVKAGATGGKAYSDWREVLAVTPEDPGALPPAITLQEACGDLPPLNPPCCTHKAAAAAADQQQCCSGAGHSGTAAGGQQQPAGSSAAAPRQAAVWLGEEVARYMPEAGIMNCPLPVDALQGRGCTPVSLFAKWARSPHAAHHALRGFDASLLHDHCVQHPNSAKLAQLLAAPEWDAAACPADRASVEAMSAKEREKLKHGGRRLAADRLMACVLGHNDPGMRFCVHFAEDRYLSLAERRRGQSLPDWVAIHGSREQARQQQVGNAVPYLLAAEVAASVWQAATGEPGRRPPQLNGPCPEGTGIADPLLLAQHYVPWLQQQQQQAAGGGWGGVLQACRRQLQQEARALQQQQQRSARQAAQQQQQQPGATQHTSSLQQQPQQTQQTQKTQQTQRTQQTQQTQKGQQTRAQQTQQAPQQKPSKQKAPLQQQQQQKQGFKRHEAPEAPGSSRKRPRGAA